MKWTKRKLENLFDEQLIRLRKRSNYVYTRGSIESLSQKRDHVVNKALSFVSEMDKDDVPFLPVVTRKAATFAELMSTVRSPGRKERGIADIRDTENLVSVPDGLHYYMLLISRWKPGSGTPIVLGCRPTTEEIIAYSIHVDLLSKDQLYAFGSLSVTCLGDKNVPGLWVDFLEDGPYLCHTYRPDYDDPRFQDGFVPVCRERV